MSGSDLPSLSNTSQGLRARVEAVRFLLGYVGARKTALLAFCLILTSLSEGFGLLLLVPVTQVIIGNVGDSSEIAWLDALTGIDPGALLAIVVVLICLRAGLVFATNQLRTDIDLSLVRELREDTYSALVRAEWRWLSGRHSADHEALLLGEAGRVGSLIDHGLFLVSASLTLFVLIGAAMLISPGLTLGVLAAAAVIALPILLLKGRSVRDAEAYADAYAELHRHVSGGVAHLRSAKIACAGSMLEDRLSFASGELRASELRYVRQGHILVGLIQALAAVILAGLVYIALVQGDVALSVFVPLLALLARAAPLAGTIAQGFRQWNHAQPALMRLRAFIAEANNNAERGPRAEDHEPFSLQKCLELREVGLRFEEREDAVFSALSCSIPAGEITAVLGPSGSGKSCLADLVSGLLEPDAGEVWVDGVALDGERRFVWRENVAYAEQSPYLFSASVADNVAWASPSASREQIEAALTAASAYFIFRLPLGMDTPVLEEGRGLSGGERQRIGLARALLRKPKLLILDEVTASLDRANRQAIRDSVAGLRGTCTVLILTHDDDLAELADHVIDLAQIASSDDG